MLCKLINVIKRKSPTSWLMHVLENVYFVYICSTFSLHCFVQFAENKDTVLY